MSTARRLAAGLVGLAAVLLVLTAVNLAIGLNQEYGVSPNGNLPYDLFSGLVTLALPVAVLTGGLGLACWALWRPGVTGEPRYRQAGRVLAALTVGVLALWVLLLFVSP
jgi:hypothetical protein